jgi:ferrous iron transport protein B
MSTPAEAILRRSDDLRRELGEDVRDRIVSSLYEEATRIAGRAVHGDGDGRWDFDQRIDRIVTSRLFGLPLMLLMLAAVFYLTILGANVPSQMLAEALFWVEDVAAGMFAEAGSPDWLTGFLGTASGGGWPG